MNNNPSNEWLDEIRRRIQEALSQAKKEKLRDQYGMEFEYTDSSLSPEAENEWLDHVLEFERQFEQAKTTTVRERIGNPPIQPLSELPLYAVDEAVTALLDFLGNINELEAYHYLTVVNRCKSVFVPITTLQASSGPRHR